MVSERAFIFHMCIPCIKTFLWYECQDHLSRSRSNINRLPDMPILDSSYLAAIKYGQMGKQLSD